MRVISGGLIVAMAAGCVTTGTYKAKVAELEQVTADHDKAAAEREAEEAKRLAAVEAAERDANANLAQSKEDAAALRKQLDDTSALAGELKKRLEKLGQNVDKLTSEKGQLAQGLADAKDRLEDLRKQKAAAEARAATFRQLVDKLRSMIDSGKLKVVIREGRMLIALPNDVLFDSGRTTVKADGQAALAQVAEALATFNDRHFVVSGHTDNVPIHTQRFASNWELSTARAVEVVNYLIAKGMKPELLAAAGHAEFDPVSSNDTSDGRAQNRRIEIVLQPNLSELPSLDALKTTEAPRP